MTKRIRQWSGPSSRPSLPGKRRARKVGFCGQGVSNSVILRGLVAIAGIVSASVVPDTYQQTNSTWPPWRPKTSNP